MYIPTLEVTQCIARVIDSLKYSQYSSLQLSKLQSLRFYLPKLFTVQVPMVVMAMMIRQCVHPWRIEYQTRNCSFYGRHMLFFVDL